MNAYATEQLLSLLKMLCITLAGTGLVLFVILIAAMHETKPKGKRKA